MYGSSSLIEGVISRGLVVGCGWSGTARLNGLEVIGLVGKEGGALVGDCVASKFSRGGASTCWGVVLRYLARLGRRNVGGRADEDNGVSKMDRRRARENMFETQ